MCSINHGLRIGDDRVITAGHYLSYNNTTFVLLFAIQHPAVKLMVIAILIPHKCIRQIKPEFVTEPQTF
jgi:uncharacterized membrane protein